MNHTEVWNAIEQFAANNSMSCSGLARVGGLDATTFNRSKRYSREGQPRWPSTQSIAKVLSATNASIDDFVACLRQTKRPTEHSAEA
jgi:phage repressor protein C with HTH and peptisase S24 domain